MPGIARADVVAQADLATKAKEASDKAALVAKEASEKAVEATRSQVAALDAKFEVSGTVERWSGVAKARATQATPEERQRVLNSIPVRRHGTPEDVAAAIAYLASEEAGFVNGASLDLNGGQVTAI